MSSLLNRDEGIKEKIFLGQTNQGLLVKEICSMYPELKFVGVDIGARGGVEKIWEKLGQNFQAVGFDPVIEECDKLNKMETKNVVYVPLWITCDKDWSLDHAKENEFQNLINNQSYERSSCVEYRSICGDPRTQHLKKTLSLKYETLDNWISDNKFPDPDYLKIDTDGHDLQVLFGARKTIQSVLAVKIECQFHGFCHPLANTFSNIDTFLQKQGFSIFDLKCHHYTRAALPSFFTNAVCAQTKTGPIMWADALYCRDLCLKQYKNKSDFKISEHTILKLACIYELFGLPDCAAEILIQFSSILNSQHKVAKLLNSLTPQINGKQPSYNEFIQFFKNNPKAFIPKK